MTTTMVGRRGWGGRLPTTKGGGVEGAWVSFGGAGCLEATTSDFGLVGVLRRRPNEGRGVGAEIWWLEA